MEIIFLRDALFSGMSSNTFKLGTVLAMGWFWQRISGCCVLYRGQSMKEMDFYRILATANPDAREINHGCCSHQAGASYYYLLRKLNCCGDAEDTLSAAAKIVIDSQGQLSCGQPNSIVDLRALQKDGNRVVLEWYYCPVSQKSKPVRFKIYGDGGNGQVDYENPLASVGYRGLRFYRYQGNPLEAGRYLFCIRTEDANGSENEALAQITIDVLTTKPEAVSIVSAQAR